MDPCRRTCSPRAAFALVVALASFVTADAALAQWGSNWGEFSWGASLAAVPALGRLGLTALVAGVLGVGLWLGRSSFGTGERRQR